ncbi:Uroporphyrinogen decarboxylase (URO-D) [Limihaloglobus sulfuriphilus]|uniref:Uroporphyrinogen decarboxylase (URO-D) n=1 Tax=Limihaloglobus sulfuriphilus TaxID=1851148 RepID=A0A1R7T5Y1_9BACT|nr:hypothetical protein [Limihaloglobus sulfuriphilus]AQQ71973.1 Uroporphyrinogen decarboxylase (URO-D) [Limihaloglobus sulfuriphilus]
MNIQNKIEKYLQLCLSKANRDKQRLWSDFLALKPSRPLVNVYFYQYVWQREIDDGRRNYDCPVADFIDKQISYRLWRWENIDDDAPLEEFLRIPYDILHHAKQVNQYQNSLWGIDIELSQNCDQGSYSVVPPIKTESDIEKITLPRFEPPQGLDELLERAERITGGCLPVKVETERMHWGPFEYIVWFRGMENLFLDFIDNPRLVHRLMEIASAGIIQWQRQRQAAGFIDSELSFFGHVPYDDFCLHGDSASLKSCWAYLHAQSSGTISPQMYEEFVQPYNERIAALVGRVYYHGCENLDRKAAVIKRLPNLRLFHISPWSNVEPILEEMGRGFAYEVHSHPTGVLSSYSDSDMSRELSSRSSIAAEVNHVLTLADVETVTGRLERVREWVRLANKTARV